MSDIVNLQSDEYDVVLTNYVALHETILKDIGQISDEIEQLSQINGGFHVEKISEKIETLLNLLEGQVLMLLKAEVELAETSMNDFSTTILQVDTACGE